MNETQDLNNYSLAKPGHANKYAKWLKATQNTNLSTKVPALLETSRYSFPDNPYNTPALQNMMVNETLVIGLHTMKGKYTLNKIECKSL